MPRQRTRIGGPRAQRLFGLGAFGWLVLNAPLLTLWDLPLRVFGVPLLPFALFAGWGVLIGVAAWIAEAPGDPE